ncbi:hypothetical protein ON010_g14171 [Phytophthora cinnamomi]|nr:hypothetical protein ON010_g14171 [Phytophthora cinnamomi]
MSSCFQFGEDELATKVVLDGKSRDQYAWPHGHSVVCCRVPGQLPTSDNESGSDDFECTPNLKVSDNCVLSLERNICPVSCNNYGQLQGLTEISHIRTPPLCEGHVLGKITLSFNSRARGVVPDAASRCSFMMNPRATPCCSVGDSVRSIVATAASPMTDDSRWRASPLWGQTGGGQSARATCVVGVLDLSMGTHVLMWFSAPRPYTLYERHRVGRWTEHKVLPGYPRNRGGAGQLRKGELLADAGAAEDGNLTSNLYTAKPVRVGPAICNNEINIEKRKQFALDLHKYSRAEQAHAGSGAERKRAIVKLPPSKSKNLQIQRAISSDVGLLYYEAQCGSIKMENNAESVDAVYDAAKWHPVYQEHFAGKPGRNYTRHAPTHNQTKDLVHEHQDLVRFRLATMYSPICNAIEGCFSLLKAATKRYLALSHDDMVNVPLGQVTELRALLEQVAESCVCYMDIRLVNKMALRQCLLRSAAS